MKSDNARLASGLTLLITMVLTVFIPYEIAKRHWPDSIRTAVIISESAILCFSLFAHFCIMRRREKEIRSSGGDLQPRFLPEARLGFFILAYGNAGIITASIGTIITMLFNIS